MTRQVSGHVIPARAENNPEDYLGEEVDFVSGDELIDNGRIGEMDSPVHPSQDLRFGGEDLSGVSEWSMRARSPELDDGLDAGDIKRSDSEILNEIWETLGDKASEIRNLEITVRGAEVYIVGKVSDAAKRDWVIDLLLNVPGVKNAYDGILVE
jgi:hypothetical protein